jgi:hypothetical protein
MYPFSPSLKSFTLMLVTLLYFFNLYDESFISNIYESIISILSYYFMDESLMFELMTTFQTLSFLLNNFYINFYMFLSLFPAFIGTFYSKSTLFGYSNGMLSWMNSDFPTEEESKVDMLTGLL